MNDFEDLRQAAVNAMPGLWRVDSTWPDEVWADDTLGNPVMIAKTNHAGSFRADARYIAAVSPERVLALLDELDSLRAH